MKLKNTLGAVIASVLATSSLSAMAQGQTAIELEAFAKRYFADSTHNITDGNLFGGSIGYFLTDDVSLNLSHGVYRGIESDAAPTEGSNIDGHLTALDAMYHFGTPSYNNVRPYVSGGVAHQSLENTFTSGNNTSTLLTAGAGLKYYPYENAMLKAGIDTTYNIDQHQTEWMAGLSLGVNFGASPAPAAPRAVEPEPFVEVPVAEEPAQAEVVRVELDVKFDFDKTQVRQESYADIENLAGFMNQYPQTTTTVEGHTDSVGTDAYNQKLSERRASAVRDVMIQKYGVDAVRVNAVGYGETRPVGDNATEEGRALNRRVEASVEAQVVPQ